MGGCREVEEEDEEEEGILWEGDEKVSNREVVKGTDHCGQSQHVQLYMVTLFSPNVKREPKIDMNSDSNV